MTAGVVDDLELVKIQKDEHVRCIVDLKTPECLLKPRFKLSPVRKLGQRVMRGLPGKPPLLVV